jgi:hypothetical protein
VEALRRLVDAYREARVRQPVSALRRFVARTKALLVGLVLDANDDFIPAILDRVHLLHRQHDLGEILSHPRPYCCLCAGDLFLQDILGGLLDRALNGADEILS